MDLLPKTLVKLIDDLGRLPGVGVRTAERYAFALLKKSSNDANSLAESLSNLHSGVKQCPVTFMLIDVDEDISPLYISEKRDKKIIAVVEDSLDVVALEKTSKFQGTYHVLGGALSPIDGVGPEQLNVDPLLERVSTDSVIEIIIATNASVEGESTALYLQKVLSELPDLTVTRLARGLPAGVDLEYADQLTLSRALEERQTV